jgi:hypothetical protein
VRQQQLPCLAALPFAFIALLAGLLALSAHPIAAVLLLLGGMGLSLWLAAAVCGERRIVGVGRRRAMGAVDAPPERIDC